MAVVHLLCFCCPRGVQLLTLPPCLFDEGMHFDLTLCTHPIASNSRRTKLLPPSSLPLCCSLRCCTRSAPGSSSSSPSLGWTVWEPWWPPMLSASSLECSSSSWRSGRGRQWGWFGSVSPSSPLPCNWPVWLCGRSSTGFNQSATFNSLVQGREWHRYSLVVAYRSLPDILWLVGIVCPRGRHLEQVTPLSFLGVWQLPGYGTSRQRWQTGELDRSLTFSLRQSRFSNDPCLPPIRKYPGAQWLIDCRFFCFSAACLSLPRPQKLSPSSPFSSQTSLMGSITKSSCWAGLKEIPSHTKKAWTIPSVWPPLEEVSSLARAQATQSGSRPGRCLESRLPAPGLPTSLPSLHAGGDNFLSTFASIANFQVQHSESLLLRPAHPGNPALSRNHNSTLHSQISGSLQVSHVGPTLLVANANVHSFWSLTSHSPSLSSTPAFPLHTFFECPAGSEDGSWLSLDHAWVWIIMFISQVNNLSSDAINFEGNAWRGFIYVLRVTRC